MAINRDLVLRELAVAFADFRSVRDDAGLAGEITSEMSARNLTRIPSAQVLLNGERAIAAYVSPDQVWLVAISDERLDVTYNGLPNALVGIPAPPWEAFLERATDFLSPALEAAGLRARRIAFVAEEVAREGPNRESTVPEVRDRLVRRPDAWALGTEWEWMIQAVHDTPTEQYVVVTTVATIAGNQSGTPFTGLKLMIDASTSPASARARFGKEQLGAAFSDLAGVARSSEAGLIAFAGPY